MAEQPPCKRQVVGSNPSVSVADRDVYRVRTGRDFTGLMDDVAIWDRALTEKEITALRSRARPIRRT